MPFLWYRLSARKIVMSTIVGALVPRTSVKERYSRGFMMGIRRNYFRHPLLSPTLQERLIQHYSPVRRPLAALCPPLAECPAQRDSGP